MSKLPSGDYHFGDAQVDEYCDKLLAYGHTQGMEDEEWLVLLYICTQRLAHEFGIEVEEADERELQ